MNSCVKDMQKLVKNKNLHQKLTPNYELGCKRVLLSGPEYYLSFNKPNLELIDTGILEFTETGIRTMDNKEIAVDLIVYATGFVTMPSTGNMTGKNNKPVFQNDNFEAYKGICVPNSPNLFILMGPNTGLGHSSMIFMIEC